MVTELDAALETLREEGRKCAKETIKNCIEQGIMVDYFTEHEEEAIETLTNQFIQDCLRENDVVVEQTES